MKAIILISICVILASGCAKRGPVGSYAGPLPEQEAVSAIADDAVSILADLYPPGHTAIRLLPAKDAENGFAITFESGLRARGFTLAAATASDALTMAYTLDMLEEKAVWYLRLRLVDGKADRIMARAYDAHGQPEAGQSRTVLESRTRLGEVVDTAKDMAGEISDAAANFWRQEAPTAFQSPPVLPENGDSAPSQQEQRHLVQRGDSLGKIAAQYNVPAEAIMQRNNLSAPDRVLLGHSLIIPAPVAQ